MTEEQFGECVRWATIHRTNKLKKPNAQVSPKKWAQYALEICANNNALTADSSFAEFDSKQGRLIASYRFFELWRDVSAIHFTTTNIDTLLRAFLPMWHQYCLKTWPDTPYRRPTSKRSDTVYQEPCRREPEDSPDIEPYEVAIADYLALFTPK